MAQRKADQNIDMGAYAAKHPRRMASGMFLVGTALGAGIMAAKHRRDRNPLQKVMDQLNDRIGH